MDDRSPPASLAQRLYGTDEPVAADRPLRAGPLTLRLRGGRLLGLCCAGREVWHGLAFVLRDADWGTPEAVFTASRIDDRGDGFSVALDGHFPVTPRVRLALRIEGSADGSLRFDGEAVPEGGIALNRLGLCLLHPAAAAGAALALRHVDGRRSLGALPTRIPPWPPFMLLRGVSHEWAPGCWADAELLGDSFELEDQRNNADASFKTYSRSNLMPRPYRLPAGVPVRQSARLSLRGVPAARPAVVSQQAPGVVDVEVGGVAGRMPAIGVEAHARDTRAPGPLRPALQRLRPAHLHLALTEADEDRDVDADGLAALLAAGGSRLRLDLGGAAAAPGLAALCERVAAHIAVFPSDDERLAAVRQAFPSARVGGGTPHYFAQLHRLDRLEGVDFVSFTVSPLVHGADDDAVMQGAESLPAMVETLRERWPGAEVHVGPSTIGVRRSPLGAQPPTDGTRRVALAAHDPRCAAQFGAAWALAQVAALAPCGVAALTLMSLSGPSGVVRAGPQGAALTPAGHLLSCLARAGRRLDTRCSAPGRAAVLAFEHDGGRTLLVGNTGPQPLQLVLRGFDAARLSWLDATRPGEGWVDEDADGAGQAVTAGRPLVLPAYAVARLFR